MEQEATVGSSPYYKEGGGIPTEKANGKRVYVDE